jgi:hypothetical protein
MAVYRWRFVDPLDTDATTRQYVFPRNPEEMSSPFPSRVISSAPTTYGGHILREGSPLPKAWTFSGTIPDQAMYEALRSWVYDRKNRLWLFDHFGRRLTLVLENFDPTPKRAYGKYWKHSYTISAQVLAVGKPTVSESANGFVVGPAPVR